MELPDLTTAQKLQALAGAGLTIVTILGIALGWFGRAWSWISAVWSLRSTQSRRQLLFFVDHLRGAFWTPATRGNGQPALQCVVYLEASNMTDGAYRIMAARLRGSFREWPAISALALVEAPRRGMYGHDYPIAAHQVVRASANFILDVRPPAKQDKVIKATVVLTDHLAKKHRIRVSFKGPKG